MFLGKLTRAFKETIGISGTHGKTTTTSLVSLCFIKAELDPNVQVGAILKQLDGNYRIGESEYLILEACEYVESFLHFHPKAEIILNIDNDHLDYFGNIENIKKAFSNYVKLLPEDGLLVYNADDINSKGIKEYSKAKTVSFGIENKEADYIAKNINFDESGFASFEAYKKGKLLDTFKLSIPGIHNVLNAMACITLCDNYNIPTKAIKEAFLEFTGAHRRLEFKGKFNDISVFDDYAHHPTEINAVADSLNRKVFNESWVVFQPHTFSRLKNLLEEFAEALVGFDHVIITDVYSAREKNTFQISSKDLVDKLNEQGKPVQYITEFENIVSFLKRSTKPGDIVLTLGAGTVTEISTMLLEGEV